MIEVGAERGFTGRRLGAAVLLALLAGSCRHAARPIRIDSGGPGYHTDDDDPWLPDKYFAGGVTFSTTHVIAGTDIPAVYKTERYGNSFRYSIPVPNGPATVRLMFAEIYFDSPGKRVFNVSINNQPVLTKFDPTAAAGGPFRAVVKEFKVNVTAGQVNILFSPLIENPKINAIEIIPGG